MEPNRGFDPGDPKKALHILTQVISVYIAVSCQSPGWGKVFLPVSNIMPRTLCDIQENSHQNLEWNEPMFGKTSS